MGNWNITIQGVGAHGNGLAIDAEQLYKQFIDDVRKAGHTLVHSSITSGGAYFDPVTIPSAKIEEEPQKNLTQDALECLFHAVSMLDGEQKDKALSMMADRGIVDI
jgi:hypothetical protein